MNDPTAKKVIVVGGGLAGMGCAVGLASRGVKVTMIEARGTLGGRAGSFVNPERPGEVLDNCQHVVLGCCTNLLDFYRRLGVEKKIAWSEKVWFVDGRGRLHGLGAVKGMPAPLHLGPGMALFGALTVRERVAVTRAMVAMLRMGRSGRDKLEGVAFGEWLDGHGQPESVVRKFYDPIVVSALNEETRRGSAKYAIQVFQEAMLANRAGYVTGVPGCPLSELYGAMPAGVEVRVGKRVEEVLWETQNAKGKTQNGVRAVGVRLRGGEELRGEAVVVATNHHGVTRFVAGLPEEVREADGRFGGLERIESVPILGAHLWFDRPVLPGGAEGLGSAALMTGPLQWIFRKDKEGPGGGRVVHGVISAARAWVGVAKEEALRQFEGQICGLFEGAGAAKLERGVVIVEKRATFAPLPGTDALRPVQSPGERGIEGLYLAGDYTRTEWPATMEGAVRGGYLAAEGVLRGFGMEGRVMVVDLPTEWPARWMGL